MRSPQTNELYDRIRGLIIFRLMLVSILLAVMIILSYREGGSLWTPQQNFYYVLLAATYATSGIFALLLNLNPRLVLQAYVQIFIDVLIVSAFIFGTGGSQSVFSFMYFLSIFSASAILMRRGGLIIASWAGIVYGLVFIVEVYDLLPQLPFGYEGPVLSEETLWTKLAFHILAFFAVALLSGYLAERVRSTEAELSAAAADLRGLESFNRQIVSSMSNGLVVLDAAGRVTYHNDFAAELLQVPPRGMEGSFLRELFRTRNWHYGHLTWEFGDWEESFWRERDGEDLETVLRFSVTPFLDEERKRTGSLLIIEDLTELKRYETQAKRHERLSVLGRMAAGIAHEIRNPLASMSGSIEILAGDDAVTGSTENRRLLQIMQRETGRLATLVNDFLDFARPSPIQAEEIELRSLVEETLTMLRGDERIGEDLRIETEIADGARVYSDSGRLRQIIWNLINNAVDAIEGHGTIRIAVETSTQYQAGVARPPLQIDIVDDGPGMSEEVLARLFEPFYTTKEKGTGLGLATVQRLVDDLGGTLSVQSRIGEGTGFCIVIFDLPRSGERPAAPTAKEDNA